MPVELVRGAYAGEAGFLPRAWVDGAALVELMPMQEEFSRRFKAQW
jgi:hypothetical protein